MKYTTSLLAIIFLFSCKEDQTQTLKVGIWRAHLEVNDTIELPFTFEVNQDKTLTILNAEEEILVDDIRYENDSVYIKLPVFESDIRAAFLNDSTLSGNFIKPEVDRIVPFKAVFNNNRRFELQSQTPSQNITGNWETVFSPDSEEDRYVAKGIFKQDGSKVTGTFLTETGDYRFLEGVMDGDTMKLSAFDGSHAFLFIATVKDSVMSGTFYSGNHFSEPFTAKPNEAFELADANTLTYLKEGYDNIEFSFPDADGKMVSLSDARFKDKVVIIQIMGTWCPNCLDESRYFSEYYANTKSEDLEFIALAFEYAKTEEAAFKNINRLKSQLDIQYPILLAQYGGSDKAKAQEKLPMLNQVLSYPTSIFIDKTGKVRKIHTGFNGPATGDKYVAFKKEFEGFVNTLSEE
uniref:TlpA disulfide reductase family protein n=1 Tax=Gelidibacter sp. TaxID=2018083 RepID=UPI00404A84EC